MIEFRNFFEKMKPHSLPLIFLEFSIIASMFLGWEMGGETWGYWYFNRVFNETGDFLIIDRSPLYILYLSVFSWISYPYSVILEYIITTSIVSCALYFLFQRYMGLWLAIFACCIWIPYLQAAEPSVQKLALAFSIFAIILRSTNKNRDTVFLSYCLLLVAYLFRQTYIIILVLYILYDLYCNIFKYKSAFIYPKNYSSYFYIILLGILILLFLQFQSDSPWNNVWFTDTEWFPNSGKTMLSGGGIQAINWIFIQMRYGSFEEHDFYFTNKEIFGGATSIFNAFINNPTEYTRILFHNLIHLPSQMMEGIYFPDTGSKIIVYFIKIITLSGIVYGSLKAVRTANEYLFIFGGLLLACVTVISIPKWRYMMPLIPIFILSANWYGNKITSFLCKKFASTIINIKKIILEKIFIIIFMLLFSSASFINWFEINKYSNYPLESTSMSMGKSYVQLSTLIRNCKGVISLEPTFFGAFMSIPLNRIYSIWEIPPFGEFKKSFYEGLRPERINCIAISSNLVNTIGMGTNSTTRYKNFIVPYSEFLKSMGAVEVNVPYYGKFIYLSD